MPRQRLRESFVTFNLRCGFRRPEHGATFRPKHISDAIDEWVLRTDHDEIDVIVIAPPRHAECVGHVHLHRARLAEFGQAGIAGMGDPQRSQPRRLFELPRQGVFASTAADEQHIAS